MMLEIEEDGDGDDDGDGDNEEMEMEMEMMEMEMEIRCRVAFAAACFLPGTTPCGYPGRAPRVNMAWVPVCSASVYTLLLADLVTRMPVCSDNVYTLIWQTWSSLCL